MSSDDANDRKRKSTQMPELVSGTDEHIPDKSKARKVSTDATPVATEKATTANTASTAAAKDEDFMQSIGKLINGLFHSDNAIANAALMELCVVLVKDLTTRDVIVTAGGAMLLFSFCRITLKKRLTEILRVIESPSCTSLLN
jgi:hypothetical protein